MKRLIPLFVLYVFVHSAQGDSVRSYEGQSRETISRLLSQEGVSGTFITKNEYDTHLKSIAFSPKDRAAEVNADRAEKVQAKAILIDKTKRPEERIDAIIKFLDLDK